MGQVSDFPTVLSLEGAPVLARLQVKHFCNEGVTVNLAAASSLDQTLALLWSLYYLAFTIGLCFLLFTGKVHW